MRVLIEAAVSAAVLAISILCITASVRNKEGLAGGAVRMLATLLLPSLVLAFAHVYFWPLSLIASTSIATWQWRSVRQRGQRRTVRWSISLLPLALAVGLLATKAALSVSSPPYDIDSNDYHLPMSIEYLQMHTAVPAQIMFHPGNAELLDALGLGALAAVGGQTLTEAVVALALFLGAYGIARRMGATRAISLTAAAATLAVPMIADQLFTAQNDVLVAALLLAFVTLWERSPMLGAIAFGLVAGSKFTGAVEAAVLLPILWRQRSPDLAWRHLAVAGAIACPWYVRNAIETGSPFFLGGQTSGFASTIAAHLFVAAPFVGTAIRNYGGLLAFLGIFCAVYLARKRDLRQTLAPLLPALVAVTIAIWLVTPNAAETTSGTLDQIRSGWSIRYALFAAALLTVAAIVWCATIDTRLAIVVASLSLITTTAREFKSAAALDSGFTPFIVPCTLALGAACASVLFKERARIGAATLAAATAFAITATAGAARIASTWNDHYERGDVFGAYAIGAALSAGAVQNARRTATIGVPALPVMGPHLERYDVSDESRLPVDAWWRKIKAENPQAIVARDLPHGDRPSVDERYLRDTGLYRISFHTNDVRVYTRRP